MDWIVVDVEIAKCIGESGLGWDDTDKLGIGVAVVYEFNTDSYRIFGPSLADQERLQKRLLQADRISGYNIWKFDYPVIWGVPGRERVEELRGKTDDLLRRIWIAQGLDPDKFSRSHAGWGLDAVAMATIQQGKTGNGAEAPIWFQSGEWPKLVDYCINDVKVERDLAEFVDKFGFVINPKTNERFSLAGSPWGA